MRGPSLLKNAIDAKSKKEETAATILGRPGKLPDAVHAVCRLHGSSRVIRVTCDPQTRVVTPLLLQNS